MWTVGYVRVQESGEGERGGGKCRGKKLLFSLSVHVQGRKKKHNVVPNDTVCAFFFIKQYMKQCHFEQNAPFHLKENGSKEVSFQISP
jgi:hypothetical protein